MVSEKYFYFLIMKVYILSIFFALTGFVLRAAEIGNLRCEYMANPLGVDKATPRLSWMIVSSIRGDLQKAYQVVVSSSRELLAKDEGDMWNTGKVESDRSVQMEYNGKVLHAGSAYFWKVRIWDAEGKVSAWSEPARWSMGLLQPADWMNARWIAYKGGDTWKKEWKQHKDSELNSVKPAEWPNTSWPWLTGKDSTIFTLFEMAEPKYDPSPLFRKEFVINKKIRAASLYVCGLGYYEAFLNGAKIGNHVLDPAWTNFEKRSLYVTYDITSLLLRGENAIGIMLGRGQYNPLCNDIWGLSRSAWIDQPKVIALLAIEYMDGTLSTIITDDSWKTCGGPIVYDDTRHGELYDARLEQKGWNSPAFNDNSWRNAAIVQWDAPLESQMMPPVRCFEPITPVKTFYKGNGITIYDIGKNIAGWARVTLSGRAGDKVLVEYCETPADSSLIPDLSPSRFQYKIKDKHYASFYDKCVNVRQQNGYILKGEGDETFECHFSYKGFQFIRITAAPDVIVRQVKGIPVHTDVEINGGFSCSNEVINQTQRNAVNSLLNNYHSIATDCPHREKQGWTADNYISSLAAMYNFNMAAFYNKWLTDLAGTQSPEGGLNTVAPSTNYDKNASTVWPAAIVFIPWDMYGFYADTRTLSENYPTMVKFVKSSLLRQVKDKPEIINEVLGDWLAPIMTLSDTMRNNTMAPPEGMTLYATASQYLMVRRLSEINTILGRPHESKEMSEWATRIGRSFDNEFFDENTGIFHGDKPTAYRQSANIVPLQYGLVPAENKSRVLSSLLQDIHAQGDRLGTGFMGTAALMDYLPVEDPELAYIIATQNTYPGWGYMIAQGANSMWESWDGYDSRNHTPFCLISGYFYKYLAGIQMDYAAPGFKHFIINPSVVGDLNFVNAWHDAPYGRIKSSWKRENGRFTLEVSIPVNTSATICVPSIPGSGITESGRPASDAEGVKYVREENGKAIFEVASGNYSFQSLIY
jgi:alpha-L-rhamnosidase